MKQLSSIFKTKLRGVVKINVFLRLANAKTTQSAFSDDYHSVIKWLDV
jgi:hypothetical protein